MALELSYVPYVWITVSTAQCCDKLWVWAAVLIRWSDAVCMSGQRDQTGSAKSWTLLSYRTSSGFEVSNGQWAWHAFCNSISAQHGVLCFPILIQIFKSWCQLDRLKQQFPELFVISYRQAYHVCPTDSHIANAVRSHSARSEVLRSPPPTCFLTWFVHHKLGRGVETLPI